MKRIINDEEFLQVTNIPVENIPSIEQICFEQNQLLYDWMLLNYGSRCTEKHEECGNCLAWQSFDDLTVRVK